jgi:hypothetical protein
MVSKKKQPVIFMSSPQETRRKCFICPSRVLGVSLQKIFHKFFSLSNGRLKLSLPPRNRLNKVVDTGATPRFRTSFPMFGKSEWEKWEGIKEKG